MRRLICTTLAILLIFAGCAPEIEPTPAPSPAPVLSEQPALPPEETPPESPDFYEVLYDRNARVVASFDFEEFSVWFAITPVFDTVETSDGVVNRWDFANGPIIQGTPMTIAVVKESAGKYILIEELEAGLDLRPKEWAFEELPDALPQMQNSHLRSVDGFRFTNFNHTDIRRQRRAETSGAYGLHGRNPAPALPDANGGYGRVRRIHGRGAVRYERG
jgi:hypothetical protein